MSNNFFDIDPSDLEETQGAPSPWDPSPDHQSWEQPSDSVQYEEEASEESMDDSEILADASLRLEQGRLYRMLMEGSLFEGIQADERAVANVEREIRKFIKERLEIMLGIKSPTPTTQGFSAEEVQILKGLVSRAQSSVSAPQPQYTQKTAPVQQRRAPVQRQQRPVSTRPAQAPQQRPVGPRLTAPANRPQQKPTPPVQANHNQQTNRLPPKPAQGNQPWDKFGISKDEYDWILNASVAELTDQQINVRSEIVADRNRRLKANNPNKIPMPAPGAEGAIYASELARRQSQQPGSLGNLLLQDALS